MTRTIAITRAAGAVQPEWNTMPGILSPARTPRAFAKYCAILQGSVAVATCLMLVGCAVSTVNEPRNLPARSATDAPKEPEQVIDEDAISMSFSGGGTRAAAFSFGVLCGLDLLRRDQGATLLDEVSFISSVSGGSITAAYFGLHGKNSLNDFRAVLLKNGEVDMRFSLLNPVNLARLLAGGLNDRSNLRTWLNDDIFHGATYADMFRRGKPVVWVNATNVQYRVAFPFSQLAFDVICSDLASFPVSEAVAASMAVPVLFSPVVLQTHPEACRRKLPDLASSDTKHSLMTSALARSVKRFGESSTPIYLKLIDGGVTDNFGLATIAQARLLQATPFAPMSEHDALRVRRLLHIVVDAGQAVREDLDSHREGPSGLELAGAAIDAAMAANTRMSYDGFAAHLQQWRDDIVHYRCGLSPERQQALIRERPDWRCDDVSFSVTRLAFESLAPDRAEHLASIATRLVLPSVDIDQLIAAGTELVVTNQQVQTYLQGGTIRHHR